jgi:diguanylate cyclase (GGDEF)-like protein
MENINTKQKSDTKNSSFFSSLHFKIILTFTGLVALITVVSGIVLIYQTQNYLQKAILQKNFVETENLKNEINSFINESIRSIETLTFLPDFKEFDPFAISEILKELIKENDMFQSATVLDKDGIEFVSTTSFEQPHNLFKDKVFRKTIKDPYVSEVYYSPSGSPLVQIAAPILDYGDFNNRLGVLIVEFKLSSLWPFIDVLDKTTGTIIAVTDNKGNLIYHTDKNLIYDKKNISFNPAIDDALEGKSGSGRFKEKNGNLLPYQSAYPSFGSYFMDLVLHRNRNNIFCTYTPLNKPLEGAIVIQQKAVYALLDIIHMQRQSLFLIAISTFLAFLIGSSTAKKLSTPLRKLIAGTKIVGSGNLNYRIDIKSKDEIGLLANSFNKMTQDLLIQRQKAITDGLTGLYTHSHFERILEAEVDRAVRYKTALSLLLLDIDFFKSFNDNYGHQVGDIVLEKIAGAFTQGLRKSDTSARYGGEEFAIIAPGTNEETIRVLGERIRQKVANDITIEHEGKQLKVTVSIGVTTLSDNDRESNIFPGDFFKRVDTALYKAKENGRNQVVQL